MAIRRSIAVVSIVGAIVLAGAAAALVFTNPDRFRPEVIAYLQNKTGKQIQISRIGVSLSPTLSIRLYDFGVKNPMLHKIAAAAEREADTASHRV